MRIHFIQHVAYESPGYLLQWAAEQNHTVSFTKMFESPVFPSPDHFDWLIVMGGPMGVYDEDKFSFLKIRKGIYTIRYWHRKKSAGCLPWQSTRGGGTGRKSISAYSERDRLVAGEKNQ